MSKADMEIKNLIEIALQRSIEATAAGDFETASFYANEATDLFKALTPAGPRLLQ